MAVAVPADAKSALSEVARMLLLSGKVLLQSGASAARIEETLMRMGLACGLDSVNVYCTLTGVFVTLVKSNEVITRLLTIKRRSIDLGAIAAMNDLSRGMEKGQLTLEEATRQTQDMVLNAGAGYPYWLRLLARGLSSGGFALLMAGTAPDFLPALLAGICAQLVHGRVLRIGPESVATFFAAIVGTAGAIMMTNLMGAHLRSVTVGMLMPRVPGMALTNAIRDLIAGDLLSGVSRGAEAVLLAAAIAGAVYTILVWFHFNLWI